ncbi:uncharacterized protein LOC115540252 [Gadus morhua]|uniref:uncharacterized protein LOC115540252 n=1 Tax=Gadus morhua TaxID=8049 RepID=UPI0011B515F4|nr:uncharacterized protein LOC115540252 [Gadus morhua]
MASLEPNCFKWEPPASVIKASKSATNTYNLFISDRSCDYFTANRGAGGESVKQQQGPLPIEANVIQRTPGPNRLSKKNLKRSAGVVVAIPCSPLALEQLQIPYKKARKDATHNGLAPENITQVIQAVINPQIAPHGAAWTDPKHRVIGDVEVHVSESPTETVTVQPDGTIQHAHGDPQCAPPPELTADDWAGLDDISSWTSSLLDHIDFTPAQWIDSPATSVEATTSAEPVQHHQPADPASGPLQAIQDPISDPPCTVSPIAHEVAVPRLPAGPAIAVDEHHAGVQGDKWRKQFADKLAVLTASVDVNSLGIARQSKLGVEAGFKNLHQFPYLTPLSSCEYCLFVSSIFKNCRQFQLVTVKH